MSSFRLLGWIALVAGAEFAVRGHVAAHPVACHGGALLFALACVALTWPTRGRRAVLAAAIVWTGLVGVDAALASWARGRVSPATAGAASIGSANDPRGGEAAGVGVSRLPAPPDDAFVVLAIGGSTTAATSEFEPAWPALLESTLRERFSCRQAVAVLNAGRSDAPLGGGATALESLDDAVRPALVLVLAGPQLLDAVMAEAPALHFDTPPPVGARASVLGAALEREWRRARIDRRWRDAIAEEMTLDPRASGVAARYRALVTGARRNGADIRLLIPPLALDGDSSPDLFAFYERTQTDARSRVLASRAHARIVRTIAGAYGVRVLDTRPGLDGAGPKAFTDLGTPGRAGRERLVEVVLAGLAERLAQPSPGCAAIATDG
jgi:hypothetical protein